MASFLSTKVNMKWPLVIAAILVVARIVFEQMGASENVNNIFGVAWLYFLAPIYFAVQIANSGVAKPFLELVKSTAIFTAYTRLMIMPTYWLAYMNGWTAPRFSITQGGVVGEGMTPLKAYLLIPVRNALIWTVFATVVGAIIGGITLAIKRRGATAKAPA
ncbi:MAG: hypothetical protein ACREOI_00300 [bacterium]